MTRVRCLLGLAALVGVCTRLAAQTDTPLPVPQLVPGPLATPEDELNAAFTPDGHSVYFTRKFGDRFGVIMVSHLRGGRWSPPTVAPFSGQYADYDPFITPDGSSIYWISLRPVDGTAKADTDIWMARWTGDDWGAATHLAAPINSEAGEFYPTIARNGALYFSSNRPGGQGRGDLYVSRPLNGEYQVVTNLGAAVNSTGFDGDPFIAPDEGYLVFTGWGRPDAGGDGDLYITFNTSGSWSAPQRLPGGVNSGVQEYAPIVSPDGGWLYFTSYRGAIDQPRTRPLTTTELRQMTASPLNGRGNVYRVPLTAILPQPADPPVP